MNERLRLAMTKRGVSPEALAAACEVDPKTVGRWLAGRLPHPRHRWTASELLRADATEIWPQSTAAPAVSAGPDALVAATYANRASVPRDLWLRLLEHAERHVDVLVYSGTFFAQSNPHVAEMLATRARHGAQVRLCFADPMGQAVARRDQEEELDGTMAAKIRASLTYYRPLLGQDRCEVRLHDATVYASLFRYDDELLANPHIWGQPASANPLLHLRRAPARGWFDHYAASFDAVWTAARPWDGTTARTSKE
ncbi:helix-turn-helix domain-containing protein [Streptacidiphilus neutrinimicus]|uniref:helix-turn-helix domain-containing protein n=1 Tax=Streptacidiphilus neutrinimicus TaxID=105420 RepID=UPI00157A9BA5